MILKKISLNNASNIGINFEEVLNESTMKEFKVFIKKINRMGFIKKFRLSLGPPRTFFN